MRFQIPILLSLLYLFSCTPKHNFAGPGSMKEDNRAILKYQMSDSLFQAIEGRHVKRSNRVIKTKKEAIKIAKRVFLKEYGKEYNVEGRIYVSHLVNGFWIARGMFPKGYTGGTLVAVFDSENGELFCTLIWK